MDSYNFTGSQNMCQWCFKVLGSKQTLKQHLNTHTGEKPYICHYENCGVSFKHASQLSNHKKQHQCHEQNTKPDFTDIKAFIYLLIQALDSPSPNPKPYQKFPVTKVTLPPISKPSSAISLPNIFSIP